MQWSQVLADASLQDLPYKIELNEWGQIEMSPASNQHGYWQIEVGFCLKQQLPHGKVISECSIETTKGVKVADVVWCSEAFLQVEGWRTPFRRAPEICVEIVSPGNRSIEMAEKQKLYFERGAQEVWLISLTGEVQFFTPTGEIKSSQFGIQLNGSAV